MTTPTKDHVELRSGAYADSVTLLQVSRAVQATPGVVAAQVAMATGLNLEVLEGMGFDVPGSSPNDMVVALRLDADADVSAALAAVDAALTPHPPDGRRHHGRPAAHHRERAAAHGSRRDRARLGARRQRHRRGDGRARGRPRRDGLQRQRAGGRGGRPQAVRRLARRAGHGTGLRHRGRRRRRARLRQRGPSRTDRDRRRLRHRLPAAPRPPPPRRRDGRGGRGAPRAGRRRSRPVVGRRRARHPARPCAGSTPTRTSTWSWWCPSPRRRRSRRH